MHAIPRHAVSPTGHEPLHALHGLGTSRPRRRVGREHPADQVAEAGAVVLAEGAPSATGEAELAVQDRELQHPVPVHEHEHEHEHKHGHEQLATNVDIVTKRPQSLRRAAL